MMALFGGTQNQNQDVKRSNADHWQLCVKVPRSFAIGIRDGRRSAVSR